MGRHVESQSWGRLMRWGGRRRVPTTATQPWGCTYTRQQGLCAGDALSMHLGVQRVRDGEDGKGGGGAEGGSRAWRLLGVVLSSWGPPGWSWRPWVLEFAGPNWLETKSK